MQFKNFSNYCVFLKGPQKCLKKCKGIQARVCSSLHQLINLVPNKSALTKDMKIEQILLITLMAANKITLQLEPILKIAATRTFVHKLCF
jgi:glutaredoxin 2